MDPQVGDAGAGAAIGGMLLLGIVVAFILAAILAIMIPVCLLFIQNDTQKARAEAREFHRNALVQLTRTGDAIESLVGRVKPKGQAKPLVQPPKKPPPDEPPRAQVLW